MGERASEISQARQPCSCSPVSTVTAVRRTQRTARYNERAKIVRTHGARLCVCAYGYCSLSLSLSPNLIDCLLDSMTLSTRSDVSVLILLLCCPQAYQVLLWLLAATARAPRVCVQNILLLLLLLLLRRRRRSRQPCCHRHRYPSKPIALSPARGNLGCKRACRCVTNVTTTINQSSPAQPLYHVAERTAIRLVVR